MRSVSPLSLTLVLGATAAAAGIEIARRFTASGREIAAVRSTASYISDRLVRQDQAVRDLRSEVSHTVRNLEIKLDKTFRKGGADV